MTWCAPLFVSPRSGLIYLSLPMQSSDVGPQGARFSFWEILPERETTKRALC
jgi:hypothetical protein